MKKPDYLTKDGAENLAKRIVRHWGKQGCFPKVWTEKHGTGGTGDGEIFCVRSEIVNGVPVRDVVTDKEVAE